jgi:hypothetical protein
MDSPSFLQVSFVICLAFLALFVSAPDRYLGTRARPDLPGPRGWPLVGNSFDIFLNRKRMLMRFHELGVSYGELFSLTLPVWGRSITINNPQWLEHVKKGERFDGGRLHPLISTQRTLSDMVKDPQRSQFLQSSQVEGAHSARKVASGAGPVRLLSEFALQGMRVESSRKTGQYSR